MDGRKDISRSVSSHRKRKRSRSSSESSHQSKPHRSTETRSEDRKKTRRNPRSFTRSKSRRKEDLRSKDALRERKHEYDSHSECDDEENHLIVRLGESLTSRYKILSEMGEGTFGKVVECWDRERKRRVAVKIIKAVERYSDAAMIEIDILKEVADKSKGMKSSCIQLLDWFEYKRHVCMIFEKCGLSLYDFIRKNHFQPFMLLHVQSFAKQLLEALKFLHDDMKLIHTDLKPENILLINSDYRIVKWEQGETRIPKYTEIKLIDFGSATFEDQHHTKIVSTRHYRAPEVILEVGWSYPCDIWSVGCILVELLTGEAMFQTHSNREHLALMERTFGPISKSLIGRASSSIRRDYFDRSDNLRWPDRASSASRGHVAGQQDLRDLIAPRTEAEDLFYDLCCNLLRYDPEKRLTASEALRHPFFKIQIPEK